MAPRRPALLIPSETQLREFDPKLLLACAAAERSYTSIVGSRMAIHQRIASMPRGIYLAKDIFRSSCKMFRILRGLGYRIVAWDEEALLFSSQELYLKRRTSPCTLSRIEKFLTWGEAGRAMLADAAPFDGIERIASGNPRMDLMRAELRGFFAAEVERLRARYGRFILVNTNFGRLNHYLPAKNLTPNAPGALALRNRQPNDLPLSVWQQRDRIFSLFKNMTPHLARSFPDRHIVIRPHPSENRVLWRELTRGLANVSVLHEGYVAPWLLAADVLIHNGCMTGIEAFLLDVPAIAYGPQPAGDLGWELPNRLSLHAPTLEALVAAVGAQSRNPGGPRTGAGHDAARTILAQHHIANIGGPLAVDTIVEVVDSIAAQPDPRAAPKAGALARAWLAAQLRGAAKRVKAFVPSHKNSAAYTRHRFGGITLAEVEAKIERLTQLTGRFKGVRAKRLYRDIFEIRPPAT